ncbi:hypothetical protein L226DRAFT_576886 [Lentinus tigrinus ALCF2SS1-7]|uniref:uncharacterized protein n=1 Tax=Lentinus tigrinus ALCF2SS1-7 TaxID=1328758 RepID=UPI001165D7FD|nr:hypothetical protein L226DRAFT_576886 [Lentinus tigrinus ALCF2SS1-7]
MPFSLETITETLSPEQLERLAAPIAAILVFIEIVDTGSQHTEQQFPAPAPSVPLAPFSAPAFSDPSNPFTTPSNPPLNSFGGAPNSFGVPAQFAPSGPFRAPPNTFSAPNSFGTTAHFAHSGPFGAPPNLFSASGFGAPGFGATGNKEASEPLPPPSVSNCGPKQEKMSSNTLWNKYRANDTCISDSTNGHTSSALDSSHSMTLMVVRAKMPAGTSDQGGKQKVHAVEQGLKSS